MKILAFSINPIFPDLVLGGAPRQLEKIAHHLGGQGHEITIVCTEIPGRSRAPFPLGERVTVHPELPFHQPFPAPYAIAPYALAEVFARIEAHLGGVDRLYIHDGELLLPALTRRVPTVVSLRDNLYPETLLGSYLCQGDRLVFVSDYSKALYLATTGRFYPGLEGRSVVIPNGIEFDRFGPPSDPGDPALDEWLGPDLRTRRARGTAILLHPHRPDPTKGLPQTLEVVDRLRGEHGWDDLLVLAPRWPDQASGSIEAEFQRTVNARIDELGLSEQVRFHPWIPRALMPRYYQAGDVTLSLGSFPETFGNSVYESLACGTPSVVTRVATHRSLLPDTLLDKVDFGDIEAGARAIDRLLRTRAGVSEATSEYLREHYDARDQVAGYAEVILGAEQREPLPFEPLDLQQAEWQLAPWCYVAKRGIFHDYLGQYRIMERLSERLVADDTGTRVDPRGIEPDELHTWCREGYIVPVRPP